MRTSPADASAPTEGGTVTYTVTDGVGTVAFGHPKSNALPGALLQELADAVERAGRDSAIRVIVLRSEGAGAFCAGASFDELAGIRDAAAGEQFFSGFARVILAMVRAPKLVVVRVQGRAAGGGVGLAAAADYCMGVRAAAVRLSELAVGIGPFVVGPAIERRVGAGPFAAMSIDTGWRDADWCERHGLFARVFDEVPAMDAALDTLTTTLAGSNPEAMTAMKRVFWSGTEGWETLLAERARTSGRLVLSDFTRDAIASFRTR